MERIKPGRWLVATLEGFVAIVLFAMMILVFIDVFARYLFAAPIPGGFELTELLLGTLIFAGLPLATMGEQHITIGLLDGLLGAASKRVQRTLINLLSSGVLAVLAWRLWEEAVKLADWGDYTAHLNIPLAPFIYVFAGMSGLAAAALLVLAWQYALDRRLGGGQQGGEF